MSNPSLKDIAKTSSEFTQLHADRLFETGGMYECYLEVRPRILAFLDTLAINKNAVADLDAMLTPMRELGFFHQNYFNNLILSFEIDQNLEDANTKERLLSVIDTNIKPRSKTNELEPFIAAYLFARLQQCGASFHQCSRFFAHLKHPRKKEPNSDRALEKTAAKLKQVLPQLTDTPWLLYLLDAASLLYIERITPSLAAYKKSFATRKPEAKDAYESSFMAPLNNFLDQSIACFGRKNAKIPADLISKINCAVTLAHCYIEAIAQGDVRKFNSTV